MTKGDAGIRSINVQGMFMVRNLTVHGIVLVIYRDAMGRHSDE